MSSYPHLYNYESTKWLGKASRMPPFCQVSSLKNESKIQCIIHQAIWYLPGVSGLLSKST
jgi:hypothetical protein